MTVEEELVVTIGDIREVLKEHFFSEHFSELYSGPCKECADLNRDLEVMKSLQAKQEDLTREVFKHLVDKRKYKTLKNKDR